MNNGHLYVVQVFMAESEFKIVQMQIPWEEIRKANFSGYPCVLFFS